MKARITRLSAAAVTLLAVTAGGLASAGPALAVAEPTITSVVPNSGPIAGGTKIVITGTGFSSASTAVAFGILGVGPIGLCLNTVVVSSTKVTCTTPNFTGKAGAGPLDMQVTGAGGNAFGGFTLTSKVPLPLTVKAASSATKLPRAGSTVVITSATTSSKGRVHLKARCYTAVTRPLGDMRLCSTSTGANGKLTIKTYGVRGVKVTVTAVAIPLAGQTTVSRSSGWTRTWAVS